MNLPEIHFLSLATGTRKAPASVVASPRRFSAFTLVETVLALGVFVFAVVSMLGVMPVALTTLRESAWRQTASEIVSGVVSEVRADPAAYVNGTMASEFPRYFDERGALLATGPTTPARAVFVVRPAAAAPSVVNLNGQALNSSLQAAAFRVSSVQDEQRTMTFQVCLTSL